MFKAIHKFVFGDTKPDVKVVDIRTEISVLDWLYEDSTIPYNRRQLAPSDYKMVGEPVITLIKSLRKNHKRFKIEKITKSEYLKESNSETYGWMNEPHNDIKYMKFTDTSSGITKTIITSGNKIWRVDNLNFNLNHWEMLALSAAFYKAKNRDNARKRLNRINQGISKRERIQKELIEKSERMKYAEAFK